MLRREVVVAGIFGLGGVIAVCLWSVRPNLPNRAKTPDTDRSEASRLSSGRGDSISNNGSSRARDQLLSMLTELNTRSPRELNNMIYQRRRVISRRTTAGIIDEVVAWIRDRSKSSSLRALLIYNVLDCNEATIRQALQGILKDDKEDAAVVRAAIEYFMTCRNPSVLPDLRYLSSSHAELSVRMDAVRALATIGGNEELDYLKALAQSLAQPAGERAFVSMSDDTYAFIAQVGLALGRRGEARAVNDVLEVMSLIPDPYLRSAIVLAFPSIGTPEALAALLAYSEREDIWNSSSAQFIARDIVSALTRFELSRVDRAGLLKRLVSEHPSPEMRSAAIRALASTGDLSLHLYFEAAEDAFSRGDRAVVKAAIEGVQQLMQSSDAQIVAEKLIKFVRLNDHSGLESQEVSVAAARLLGELPGSLDRVCEFLARVVQDDHYHIAVREASLKSAFVQLKGAGREEEVERLLKYCVEQSYWTGLSKVGADLLVTHCAERRNPALTERAKTWIRAALLTDPGTREDRSHLTASLERLERLGQ